MPELKKGESKKEFVKRCAHFLIENEPETITSKDKPYPQAYAIANSMYDKQKKKKKKNEGVLSFEDFVQSINEAKKSEELTFDLKLDKNNEITKNDMIVQILSHIVNKLKEELINRMMDKYKVSKKIANAVFKRANKAEQLLNFVKDSTDFDKILNDYISKLPENIKNSIKENVNSDIILEKKGVEITISKKIVDNILDAIEKIISKEEMIEENNTSNVLKFADYLEFITEDTTPQISLICISNQHRINVDQKTFDVLQKSNLVQKENLKGVETWTFDASDEEDIQTTIYNVRKGITTPVGAMSESALFDLFEKGGITIPTVEKIHKMLTKISAGKNKRIMAEELSKEFNTPEEVINLIIGERLREKKTAEKIHDYLTTHFKKNESKEESNEHTIYGNPSGKERSVNAEQFEHLKKKYMIKEIDGKWCFKDDKNFLVDIILNAHKKAQAQVQVQKIQETIKVKTFDEFLNESNEK